jgi:putative peptide zinc metalloprotease protein
MTTAAPVASEVERRKQVKIRLRTDLVIDPQKYEGRTYYVVKDPVSLRYYRLKDHEHFLIRYMDGQHTLEDAQKEYEKRYRPDRLKLEELEAFAQQLLTAGLAQNESPRAGQQLFDRRKKRKRTEWMQTLTNILYIKIPVIDPDKVLTRMLKYLGFIFTMWFFLLSVGFMLSAILLVATHFDVFRSKLPSYHEFFSFKTIVYLWVALGAVKIIHEFGHGLSCKKFGGEVHEMGLLFLCLSPALYCNVSDAWTLPNKWHRIIISAAGIYVELVIAAAATFIWWNTPTQPFIHNLSLSLMVVCSVSTVVFNANPLMRYDGYYVVADWLEIPNLRERSNRFLQNLFMEHCLGIEVPPEEYMALWRRILFVTYAIVSYCYYWFVTFAILRFMYSFLRPYKLEVISSMLTLGAIASMAGWPLYRLGKNIHRRGRLPDMKRWRVIATCSVAAAILLFVFFVPVPISRIRGTGIIESVPDAQSKVFVSGKGGTLEKLNVKPGQVVHKGDELAVFVNHNLDYQIESTRNDVNQYRTDAIQLERQVSGQDIHDLDQKPELVARLATTKSKLEQAQTKLDGFLREQKELVLLAPRDGIVGIAPKPDDVGKFYERQMDPNNPFCTINDPTRLRVVLPLVTPEFNQLKETVERSSSAVRSTMRHLVQSKVTAEYDKKPLNEVVADIEKQVRGLKIQLDPDAELSPQLAISYHGEQLRLASFLDTICNDNGLGYIVVMDDNSPLNGHILIRPGADRIFPGGVRPMADLNVQIRIQGRDMNVWKGKLEMLPESEAATIPLALSSRGGGPVPVKAERTKTGGLLPQTQYYLVYVDIESPDAAIIPGNSAQVKIYCKPETIASWLWRTINTTFDLHLM